eukprot:SAG22_NODE_2794_length_2208_cov_1.074917_1_plen_364_part_00
MALAAAAETARVEAARALTPTAPSSRDPAEAAEVARGSVEPADAATTPTAPTSRGPGPVEAVEAALRARGLLRAAVFTFDTAKHAELREAVAIQLKVADADRLGELHKLGPEESPGGSAGGGGGGGPQPKAVKSSQRTKGKRRDPAALARLRAAVAAFVCEEVAPHLAAAWAVSEGKPPRELRELYFQGMPALRCMPPSDRRAGQPHCDRDYGHQPGQINLWLPLCSAEGANTLWVDPHPDHPQQQAGEAAATPLEGDWGVCHRFYGNGCRHFTVPNTTGRTRVSLDLRVVPGPLYDNDHPLSRQKASGNQAFFVSRTLDGGAVRQGWYSRAVLDPDTRVWVEELPAVDPHDQPGRRQDSACD